MGPFDRFTDEAKRVLALAQDEAIRHRHDYIGTEHLLAGLLRFENAATKILAERGHDLERVREALGKVVPPGEASATPSEMTLSPRTKKILELAIDEARLLGSEHVGPEHLLLALLRESEGIAAGVLASLGVTLDAARERARALAGTRPTGAPPQPLPGAAASQARVFRPDGPRFVQFRPGPRIAWLPGVVAGAVAAVVALAASIALDGAPDLALAATVLAGFVALALLTELLPRRQAPLVVAGAAERAGEGAFAGRAPFDRFNDRAKRVIALAQDEAIRFNHNYIGTEHLLLGLVREGEGIASGVLESLGVSLEKVRHQVIATLGQPHGGGPQPSA